ncbi:MULTISPECIES: hypothetical protein [Rhodococcus]|uniref:Condensation domain-containing protein n=1 Tax=Rhodococcus cercidiphylli TaxID=489916 RepID=A0ABU4B0D7_9NOCA|nr:MULTISPECIES: hypothetical protein [Rhodococcus]MDV6231955.1 hypothetical protein [Rhodococcus cercidiphylli]MDV8054133.1 hypothetical protein [Rhodococcus sp. IEGM 1343]
MRSAERRYRSTALDRVFADTRIVTAVGPVRGLDIERTRATLRAAERVARTPHVALEPRSDTRQWRYRSDIAGDNVTAGTGATEDLGRMLTDIRRRDGARGPLEVIVFEDHLAVDYSHGIGDGQIGVMMLAAFSDDADGTLVPALATGLPASATWKALWRHYSRHPKTLADFWKLRGRHRAEADGDSAPRRRIENWESAKVSRAGYMNRTRVDELKHWTAEYMPGATAASISTALWSAALRAEGVDVDDHIMVLFNSRRYLDPAQQSSHGNFAVGIPLHLPSGTTPVGITAAMREVIESGWPIAVLGMSLLRDAATRFRSSARAQTDSVVEVPETLRLAVSDLGRLRVFDHLDWADDGRPPQMAASLEPDGPDGCTMLIAEIAGGRTYTASFCSKMIDVGVVDAALRRMCDDPVLLLRDAF